MYALLLALITVGQEQPKENLAPNPQMSVKVFDGKVTVTMSETPTYANANGDVACTIGPSGATIKDVTVSFVKFERTSDAKAVIFIDQYDQHWSCPVPEEKNRLAFPLSEIMKGTLRVGNLTGDAEFKTKNTDKDDPVFTLTLMCRPGFSELNHKH